MESKHRREGLDAHEAREAPDSRGLHEDVLRAGLQDVLCGDCGVGGGDLGGGRAEEDAEDAVHERDLAEMADVLQRGGRGEK